MKFDFVNKNNNIAAWAETVDLSLEAMKDDVSYGTHVAGDQGKQTLTAKSNAKAKGDDEAAKKAKSYRQLAIFR